MQNWFCLHVRQLIQHVGTVVFNMGTSVFYLFLTCLSSVFLVSVDQWRIIYAKSRVLHYLWVVLLLESIQQHVTWHFFLCWLYPYTPRPLQTKKLSTYHIIVLVLLINHRVSYCHLQVLGKSCLGKIYQPNSICFVKTIKYIHLDFGTVANGMKLHKTNIILSSALYTIENRETVLSWTCIGTFGLFGCYSFYEWTIVHNLSNG